MRRVALRSVVRVNERLQLFDDEATVEVGLAADIELRVGARRVLLDALLARVVDADDDERLYRLRRDERLRRLVNPPLLPRNERGRAIEEVLPVVQVEHGVAPARLLLVAGRQVD